MLARVRPLADRSGRDEPISLPVARWRYMNPHDAPLRAAAHLDTTAKPLARLALVLLAACGGGDGGTSGPPAVASVAVSPGTVALNGFGTEGTVSAALGPSGATGTISWRSADPSIATVSGSGSSATVRALAAGSTQAIASVGSLEGRSTITVTPIVKRITVPSSALSVRVLSTATLVATVEADAGANAAVQWSSSTTSIATVSATGVVTGVAVGSATITVASVASPTVSATVTVTVTPPTLRTVTVSPATASLVFPGTQQLTATVDADVGASTTLDWSSSANAVAIVSSTGLVTAVGPGSATVTARSQLVPTASASAVITVSLPAVTVVITPANPRVLVGATRTLVAQVSAAAGVATTVTWGTTAPAVATVSASGVVSALSPGTATITATSTANPTVSAMTIVTVATPTVTALALTPTTAAVFVNGSRTIVPTITAEAGANLALEWNSSNVAVATVNAGGVVTGITAGGPVTITARSIAVPTISATATVTVSVASWTSTFAPAALGTGGALTNLESQFLWNGGLTTALLAAGFQGANISTSAGALLLIRNGVLSDVTPIGEETVFPAPVAGNSADDIMTWRTDGSAATARRWNGSSFSGLAWPNAVPNLLFPRTIVAAGTARYWAVAQNSAVGGAPAVVATFDGTAWSVTSNLGDGAASSAIRPTGLMTAMLMTCKLVGTNGGLSLQLYRIQGAVATELASPITGTDPASCRADLSGVAENDLIAATDQGVARWNGTQWSVVSAGLAAGEFPRSTTQCGANRYALSNRGRVFAVQSSVLVPISADGEAAAGGPFGLGGAQIDCAPDGTLRLSSGFALLTRYTTSGWLDEHYAPRLDAVHLASPDRGLAAGPNVVFAWTSTGWRQRWRSSAVAFTPRDVWSEADGSGFVVGDIRPPGQAPFAAVLTLDASGARLDSLLGYSQISSVWRSAGTTYVAANASSGATGTLLRRTGGGWEIVATLPTNITSISGVGNFALAVSGGQTLRFNGSNWTPIDGPVRPVSKIVAVANNLAYGGTCQFTNDIIQLFNGTAWVEQNTASVGAFSCVLSMWATSPTDVFALVNAIAPRLIHFDGATWQTVGQASGATTQRARAAHGVAGLSLIVGNSAMGLVGTPPQFGIRSGPVSRRP